MREVKNIIKIKSLSRCGKKRPAHVVKKIAETRRRLYAEGKIIPPMLGKNRSNETRQKISRSKKGKITNPDGLFKPGNNYGKLRKGIKHSDKSKEILRIKKLGIPCPEHIKELNRQRFLKNNPMKNPEICKKQHSNLKGKRPDVTLRNLINHPLKKPGAKENMKLKLTGRKLSEEHKQSIRNSAKDNPKFGMSGKHHTNETKEKLRSIQINKTKKEVNNENNLFNNPITA